MAVRPTPATKTPPESGLEGFLTTMYDGATNPKPDPASPDDCVTPCSFLLQQEKGPNEPRTQPKPRAQKDKQKLNKTHIPDADEIEPIFSPKRHSPPRRPSLQGPSPQTTETLPGNRYQEPARFPSVKKKTPEKERAKAGIDQSVRPRPPSGDQSSEFVMTLVRENHDLLRQKYDVRTETIEAVTSSCRGSQD